MEQLLELQQTSFVQGVLNRIPDPNPFIPIGRDNIERELQQQIYDCSEMIFLLQFPLIVSFLLSDLQALYVFTNLTVMDWYCGILAHILFVLFFTTLFDLKYIGRREAYLTHIPNCFVLLLLEVAVAVDTLYYSSTGVRLRQADAPIGSQSIIQFAVILIMLYKFGTVFCLNVRLYLQLRNHQKILDAISPKLPYKHKGE